jgi:hypothetical protein
MAANLIWSVINILPVYIFCYKYVDHKSVYIFIAISLPAIFLPKSFLNKIQLANSTSVYKKLGADLINKFIQNGDFINNLIKKKYPEYKVVYNKRKSIDGFVQQTFNNEKFHWFMFVFFMLTIVYAVQYLKNTMSGQSSFSFVILYTISTQYFYSNM